VSDQCKHCTVRGDLKECESQPCTTHESWYVKQLTERAERAESKIEKAINYVDEYLVHGDEGLMNEMKDAMMMEDES